ncbi:sensor domain-containing diguanylate cyclase [Marinomonas pollencensis]|uniref:Diguanylate cyclase with GAF sensor n=1 Tax=Marinomonas pollencensis TaxID=491954 RepID=A0A3E0DQA8_9GAMM|nr:sensor domain-containing diguanylate cyclase [Marinomonas pollencensis]REG84993.1 diguanylate cyclase with GAF sensor [Marinomonas pollencensis]
MEVPKPPLNEAERLEALRGLKILDTSQDERFDRITRMAKRIFKVPIVLVTFVDEYRQWFKSSQGLDITETPREVSFCTHAINQDSTFIVPNALEDERFFDSPLVEGAPNIRFYAGYPLKLRPGVNLGTLCLIDTKPRELSREDLALLEDFGAMIEQEIKAIQWATMDDLTRITNRRGFITLAEHTLKVCSRREQAITLILFDLDKFKQVNDRHGHHEGDFALVKFADTLKHTFRKSDITGRFGGDEFIVMLAGTEPSDVDALLLRFENAIAEMNATLNKPYRVEYSVGVAFFPYDSQLALEKMIEQADAAMYKQKNVKPPANT